MFLPDLFLQREYKVSLYSLDFHFIYKLDTFFENEFNFDDILSGSFHFYRVPNSIS